MIIGAFVSPHPPVAVREIGGMEIKKIPETIKGYKRMAEKIAEWKPDTIIISSPHAVLYRDWFNVSSGTEAYGDFGAFGADSVSIEKQYDAEFTDAVNRLMRQDGFPGGKEYDRDKMLDHGTMVPLYFIDQKYTNYKLVRVSLSGFSLPMHYRFGEYLAKAGDILNRRTVFIASGDLSHCQKKDGPYGYKREGVLYDEKIMKTLGSGNFGELFEYDPVFLEKAQECGHRSFVIMAGALDKKKVKPHVYSHENIFGVGYGIVSFDVEENDDSRNFLSRYETKERTRIKEKEEDVFVRLARNAVETWVKRHTILSSGSYMNHNRAGVFVTLHEFGLLRGCIGTVEPMQSSIEKEIIHNAVSSCSNDPRFEAVREEELPYLDISVDELKKPEKIDSIEELDIRKYGVIVSTADGRRGLLLPDIEGVDSVEEQISIAAEKGNISLEEPHQLERFEVVRHV